MGDNMDQTTIDSDNLPFLDAEYRELNNHVRECWKYISDLLRGFLFLQIILLSLVFLGGNTIKLEGVNVGVTSSQSIVRSNEGGKGGTSETVDSIRFRKLAILPLIFVGLMASAGAAVQNQRLFANATNFVRRAAFIERMGQFPRDERLPPSERTSPANEYMSAALYSSGRRVNLGMLLAGTYGFFVLLWAYYTVILIRIDFNF